MRALAIHHDPESDAGYIGERAVERGIELVDLVVCEGLDQPVSNVAFPDPTRFDVVLSFGAVWSVYDRDAIGSWIDRELALLARAHSEHVPVFGICFGGQALSAALGGTVSKAERLEIGWHDIVTDRPDVVATGPWLQWHGDRFTVPAGALEIARGELGPQAFVAGRSLGVQFHPEATPEVVELWADLGSDMLDEARIARDELLAETAKCAPIARKHAHALLDFFLDEVARRGSASGESRTPTPEGTGT